MIGRTNAGSGTGGLIINVVGGLSQPENPTYGTVWLETEVPINGWEILSVAPDWEAAEGHVYLQDAPSTSGDTPNFSIIDAAKKPYGAIWERLIGAFQRINGEWVRLNGAMWRDGVWTPFFGATINITYPAGSTCTATDGVTTLAAPDTTGVWACVVPNAGAWTVSLDSGFSERVDVTTSGEVYTIDKWYLYCLGDERTAVTGGWNARAWKRGADYTAVTPTVTKGSNYILAKISATSTYLSGVVETKNDIDLTGFSKLCVDVDTLDGSKNRGFFSINVCKRNVTYFNENGVIDKGWDMQQSRIVSLVDISSISGKYDILFSPRVTTNVGPDYVSAGKIHNIWLEV